MMTSSLSELLAEFLRSAQMDPSSDPAEDRGKLDVEQRLQRLRERLSIVRVATGLGGTEAVESLPGTSDARLSRFSSHNTVVAFGGVVSQGKTTVINAAIGRDLLPHDDGEVTGVVCEIGRGSTDQAVLLHASGWKEELSLDRHVIEDKVAVPIGGRADDEPVHDRLSLRLANWPLPPRLLLFDMPGEDKQAGRLLAARLPESADVIAYVFKVEWDPAAGDHNAGGDPGAEERLINRLRELCAEKHPDGLVLIANGYIAPLAAGRDVLVREWRTFRERVFPAVCQRLQQRLAPDFILPRVIPIAAHAAMAMADEEEDFGLGGLRTALWKHGDPASPDDSILRKREVANVLRRIGDCLSDVYLKRVDWEAREEQRRAQIAERKIWEVTTRQRLAQAVGQNVGESQTLAAKLLSEVSQAIDSADAFGSSDAISAALESEVTQWASVDARRLHAFALELSLDPDARYAALLASLDELLRPPRQRVVPPTLPGYIESFLFGSGQARGEFKARIAKALSAVSDHWEAAKAPCARIMSAAVITPWSAPPATGPEPAKPEATELALLKCEVHALAEDLVRRADAASLRSKHAVLREGALYQRPVSIFGGAFMLPPAGELAAWSMILGSEEAVCVVNSHQTEARGGDVLVDAALNSPGQVFRIIGHSAAATHDSLALDNIKPSFKVQRRPDGAAFIPITSLPPSLMLVLHNRNDF